MLIPNLHLILCSKRASADGFTLTELLVTVVILGLVATFFIPEIMNNVGESQWNAEAENTAMRLYAGLEDAKEKLGLLPQDLGPARAIIPRGYVGSDTSFYGTTNIMSVSDPLGNSFGAGLPAASTLDYFTGGNSQFDPEDRCKTDVGNYTIRWKSNTFTANLAPTWPASYMGDCVNLICIFNARQNRRIYVALFRKSNRIVTANAVSPTFDSVTPTSDCVCLTDAYSGTETCQ